MLSSPHPHPPIEISFCNGTILSPFGDICMSYVGRNFKDDYISKVYGKRILMYCLILCFMFCFMFKSCSSVLLIVRWQLILLQGGVGLRIRVYDRKMCFVSNHFAAHLEAVSRRNADFDHIYRTMAFNKPHGSTGSCFTFFEVPVFLGSKL